MRQTTNVYPRADIIRAPIHSLVLIAVLFGGIVSLSRNFEVSTPSIYQRLLAHRIVGAVPEHEIAWVAAHGVFRELVAGDVLTSKEGQVEGIHIVLDGHLSIHVDRGTGRRKIMEWRAGDVTGLMPYSRLISPPGDVVAEEPSEVVTIHRSD